MKKPNTASVVAMVGVALIAGCSKLGGKYTATSTLRVSTQQPTLLRASAEHSSDKAFEIYKQTQRQLVTSRFVLMAALRKPDVAKLPSAQEQGDPVEWLQGIIHVKFPGDTELMEVSASRKDPREAAVLVRAVVDAYLTEVVNAERDMKRQRISELDRAFVEKEAELRAKREDLKKLAEVQGTTADEVMTPKQQLKIEEYAAIGQQLLALQTQLRSFEVDLGVQKAFLENATEEDRAAIAKEIKRLEASIAVVGAQEATMRSVRKPCRDEIDKIGMSTVDIEMLRVDIRNQTAMLGEIAAERDRLKVEIRATPRVTLLQRAETPEIAD